MTVTGNIAITDVISGNKIPTVTGTASAAAPEPAPAGRSSSWRTCWRWAGLDCPGPGRPCACWRAGGLSALGWCRPCWDWCCTAWEAPPQSPGGASSCGGKGYWLLQTSDHRYCTDTVSLLRFKCFLKMQMFLFGMLPVCIRSCTFMFAFLVNSFPQ